MSSQIGNLICIVIVWGLAAYTFVFGFAHMQWTSWSVGLPWMFGVSFLFGGAAYTSKWLMNKTASQL
jgi:type IV secretory pathway VirB2 component (pilin)